MCSSLRLLVVSPLLALLLACTACNKPADAPDKPVLGAGPGGPGPGGPGSPMKAMMVKIGRGPQSLSSAIGKELQEASPPWDQIQPQAKEYAELAASLTKTGPPRGSKESWQKLTAEFAAAATSLDKAAQAKDKDAALAAHKTLSSSCMECHRAHRGTGGPGVPGSFGGFPQPGQIMPAFLQERLKLTAEQKQEFEQLQKEVDAKIEKILTDDQKKQLKELRERGPGGFGPGGFGPGGPGGFRPPPGGAAPPG